MQQWAPIARQHPYIMDIFDICWDIKCSAQSCPNEAFIYVLRTFADIFGPTALPYAVTSLSSDKQQW